MIQNDVLGNAKAEGRAEERTEEKYKIALSLLEQVFEGDDTLEATGIFIVFQSEGRDERHDGGLSYFGFLHEGGKLVSQHGIISFIDNEIGVVEFISQMLMRRSALSMIMSVCAPPSFCSLCHGSTSACTPWMPNALLICGI